MNSNIFHENPYFLSRSANYTFELDAISARHDCSRLVYFSNMCYIFPCIPRDLDKMCLLTVWNNQWNGIKYDRGLVRVAFNVQCTCPITQAQKPYLLKQYTRKSFLYHIIHSTKGTRLVCIWLRPFWNARFGDAWNKIKNNSICLFTTHKWTNITSRLAMQIYDNDAMYYYFDMNSLCGDSAYLFHCSCVYLRIRQPKIK